MKFNFLKKYSLFSFNLIFLMIISLAFLFSIINPFFKDFSKLYSFILFFIFISFFCILLFLIKDSNVFALKVTLALTLLLFLSLLIFFGLSFAVSPDWDLGHIFRDAQKASIDNSSLFSNYYFSKRYPNNLFITVLLTKLYKVFRFFNLDLVYSSIFFNIFVIFISVLVTCFIIYKLFNLKICVLSSFLFCLVTPFYTYSPIFYTDTLTLVFIPVSFLIFLHYLKNTSWLSPILIGFILAIGTGIKANIIIFFVALLIYICFYFDKINIILKFYLFSIITFIFASVCITMINQSYLDCPIKKAGLPSTHWVMMGLSGDGGYNHKDVLKSLAHGPDKDKIKDFNISEIKNRLNNYGFTGYSKFLYKKFRYTWTDGTYFAPVKLSRKPIAANNFHSYIYGNNKSYFYTFSQGSHILLLFLILIGSLSLFRFNSKANIIFLCNICIFGVFLFLLLWEARSRYLVCILPLFIISASCGINFLNEFIANKLGGNR